MRFLVTNKLKQGPTEESQGPHPSRASQSEGIVTRRRRRSDIHRSRQAVPGSSGTSTLRKHWRKPTRPYPSTTTLIRTSRCWPISSR